MMTTGGGSEKRGYFQQTSASQSVETGVAFNADRESGSTYHSTNSRWFSLLLGLFFGFMIVVVTRQQVQIFTMQKELNDLLRMKDLLVQLDGMQEDEIPDGLEKLTSDGNRTQNAIVSRHKRQSTNSNVYAYAHIIGNGRTQAWPAFLWASPTSSPGVTARSYYSNVELYKPSGDNVRALRVLCSGWYYVYAQIPYKYDQDDSIGHEIVRLGRCGRSGSGVTLLKTTLNIVSSGSASNHDWKYLGGVVYLPASSHVEVRPIGRIVGNYIDSSPDAYQQGAFFGLYLIRSMTPTNCLQSC